MLSVQLILNLTIFNEEITKLCLKQKIFVAMETDSFTIEKRPFSVITRHKQKRHKVSCKSDTCHFHLILVLTDNHS